MNEEDLSAISQVFFIFYVTFIVLTYHQIVSPQIIDYISFFFNPK